MTRLGPIAVSIAVAMTASSAARSAEPDRAEAKAAYDLGVKAHKRRDYRRAAVEFARADALAPSKVALQAALNAAIESDDAVLGSELIERSKREPASPSLAAAVTTAHLKFKGRAGRVKFVCPTKCVAKIDERAVDADKIAWAKLGEHTLSLQIERDVQTKRVEVVADQIVEFAPATATEPSTAATAATAATAPAPPVEPPSAPPETVSPSPFDAPSRKHGDKLPPIYFYGASGVTVVAAGLTTVFMLNASSTHGDFEDAGCAKTNFPQCQGLKEDGESSQTLANVALAATLVAGIGTAILGVAFTNWERPLMGMGSRPGGLRVTF